MITFKNQPRLSEYEVDQKYNERRLILLSHMEQFLSTDELFKEKEINVEFSHSGISSLLSFIEANGEKYVLKIPLRPTMEGETQFLKEWEAVNVPVPHVYKEGVIANFPYILMQYVDAPLLMDAINNGTAKKDISIDIGKTLAKMHTSKAEGCGRIIKGKPEHKTFKEWVISEDLQKRFHDVQENNLLGDKHGALTKVLDTLIAYAEADGTSTYCHFDFGANNILATEPLTVIDPDPMVNNSIIDIGRSVLLEISGGYTGEQLKEGYFGGKGDFDAQALQASVILNAYWKFPYWYKKNKTKQIEHVRRYLSQTSHFLK